MIKSINQLENARQEKIRSLNLEETKAYIKSLNLKKFKSNTKEDIDFYNDKLKEVFDLTEDKFINLDFYSLNNQLDLTASRLLEANLKSNIAKVSYTSLLLNNGFFILKKNIDTLKILLDDDRPSLDSAIRNQVQVINYLLHSLDYHQDLYSKESIERQLKEIEYEKHYVNEKADEIEGVKLLKEDDYLDLLETFKLSLESLMEIIIDYSEAYDETHDFLDGVFDELF